MRHRGKQKEAFRAAFSVAEDVWRWVHREESLPASIKTGGSVRKGTMLVFMRDHAGNLSAHADDHQLITVRRSVLPAPLPQLHSSSSNSNLVHVLAISRQRFPEARVCKRVSA